jgi:inosine-uridine nucleoside N-ribohydrolase
MKRVLVLFALALAIIAGFPANAGATRSVAVFVDTDIGADDAVALAWLLQQRQINLVGLTTVQGNTSVENATRNSLTLLAAARRSIPVTIGAAQPLEGVRTRTGALVHGPDGLWFAQQPLDISTLPTDAPAAIAAQARANPATIFIALGPLTNFAQAVQRFPSDLANVRLVALGGGTRGNSTPVAEFNIYADPLALEVVLASAMNVELVTLDAFDEVRVDSERFIEMLERRRDPLGNLLVQAFGGYIQAQALVGGDEVAIPDAAAVVYALNERIAEPTSALIQVVTDNGKARGQTIIGTTLSQRIPMLASDSELGDIADRAFTDPTFNLGAELGAILARQPDNALVIFEIDERQVTRLLERSLRR